MPLTLRKRVAPRFPVLFAKKLLAKRHHTANPAKNTAAAAVRLAPRERYTTIPTTTPPNDTPARITSEWKSPDDDPVASCRASPPAVSGRRPERRRTHFPFYRLDIAFLWFLVFPTHRVLAAREEAGCDREVLGSPGSARPMRTFGSSWVGGGGRWGLVRLKWLGAREEA
jgi:hypothetical protein